MTTTSLLISTVLVACAALSSVAVVEGFTTPAASSSSNIIPASSLLASSQGEDENAGVITTAVDSRRDFMSTVASFSVSAAGAAVMSVAGSGVLAPLPANAASGDKINARLKAYGLPPMATKIPDGMKPLLEVYGKGKNRFPLLVYMNHPFTWVVQLPSNDVNGEDGTIQAGEYAKGDTATFFVYEEEGGIADITTADKKVFERTLTKAISQKGGNMYQDFKVKKVTPSEAGKYMLCDFQYTLLTGAGFEVQRSGVASVTSVGPAIEALWAASTRVRYKKTESDLRTIVSSFRVYPDVDLSKAIAANDAKFNTYEEN